MQRLSTIDTAVDAGRATFAFGTDAAADQEHE
jgi:hypothetical protein